jgi:hypothetical protein
MYTIQCSEKQVEIMKIALDLYARLRSGQMSELYNLIFCNSDLYKKFDEEQQFLIREKLDEICNNFYVANVLGGNGASEPSDIAWDIFQVLRHQLTWDKHPEGGMTVDFDTPLISSPEKLIKVSKTTYPIKYAAIKNEHGIFTGKNHAEIIKKLVTEDKIVTRVYSKEQGFVDTQGNFLTRKEAYKCAVEHGQIEDDNVSKVLISEMLPSYFRDSERRLRFRLKELEEKEKMRQILVCRTCGSKFEIIHSTSIPLKSIVCPCCYATENIYCEPPL